ncbi:MAG: 1,2-phenylacetyl-CoA epoxidase subunit PaaC [Woeseiaceae bacterium]
MSADSSLLAYTARLGDNALILGQRMIEAVTLYPELEEELANANFALDYIGQARLFYSYASKLEGEGRGEDDFAFLRDGHEYRNLLLLEQPNGHFGDMMAREFLFESFYLIQLEALQQCGDAGLAEIAARAVKEIRYHLRHVSQWVVRLGDGTEESHGRIQQAIDDHWRFTGELFAADELDDAVKDNFAGPDLDAIRLTWHENVAGVLAEATLAKPEDAWMASGGKQGRHSEHLGYLLAEMQHLQRSHPGASW